MIRRTLTILALALALVVTAAPAIAVDIPSARQAISAADDKAVSLLRSLDASDNLVIALSKEISQRDKEIARINADHVKELTQIEADHVEEIGRKNTEIDGLNAWSTKIILIGFAGLCVISAVLAALSLTQRDVEAAAVWGLISGVSVCVSLAIQHKGGEIAAYSGWGLGLLVLAGVGYVIVRGRSKLEVERAKTAEAVAAGVEHANTLPLLERAGILVGDALYKAKAVAWQETGDKADEMSAIATGRPVEELEKEADAAAAKVTA